MIIILDILGRRNAVTYPSGKMFKWHYDSNGFMDRVRDAASNTVIWQATATDRWGNTTEFTEGNIGVVYGYDPVSGLVTGISARRNGQPLFGQACSWTTVGNLEWRTDTTLNLREDFAYDRFNRLTSSTISDLAGTLTNVSEVCQFDSHGNVMAKDGVGIYDYEHATNPYAVTGMSPDQLVVDHLADQHVTYTGFDKVDTIRQSGNTLTVHYGIDRQRVTQSFCDGKDTWTKRYFTPLYETETKNGVTKKLHYLTSASGLFAIFVSTSSGGGTMYYTLKDHQGSLTATVHGSAVERLSYDPWGRRRNTSDFGYDNVSHTFDRGYTLHEHYDEFDLINMNGRLYDPILGRMLSPDVVIQDEQNSQAYNRYSYCMNNPVMYSDPDGEIFGTIFGFVSDLIDNVFVKTFTGEKWDWTQTKNGWEIDKSIFHTDPNKTTGERVWEVVSRFTWQLPQTIIGDLFVSGANALGYVNDITHGYGVTAVDMGLKDGSACTIGYFSAGPDGYKADWRDHLFVHEYGHYIQSQQHGPLYMFSVAIPSGLSALIHNKTHGSINHRNRWFEADASYKGAEYFDKNYGSGTSGYVAGSPDYFDKYSFSNKALSPYINPRTNSRSQTPHPLSGKFHWTDIPFTGVSIEVLLFLLLL